MANRLLVAISSSINCAIEQEWIPSKDNPCRPIKKYPEKSRERFLNQEEIDRLFALLDECDQNRTEMLSVTNLIRLLLFTGCRLSEILTLK
ncbi:MAG: hypothetical protein P8P30_03330 [Rickettsiales bacterium]|nr:hypothetical protein [Rickettsiales bacterium]